MPPRIEKEAKPSWFIKNLTLCVMTVFFSLSGFTVWFMHSSAVESINTLNTNFENHQKNYVLKYETVTNQIADNNIKLNTIEVEAKNQKAIVDEIRKDLKALEELKADVKVIKTILLKEKLP